MSDHSSRLEFYASAAPGTESAVRDELAELGFRSTRLNRGGIPFMGSREDGWRACLQARTAQRIMRVLTRFNAPTPEALYDGVRALDLSWCLTPSQTLAVAAHVHSDMGMHSGFAALRVKDAIVDRIRDEEGSRPDISRDDPDVRVFVYLARDRATVYLDLSGSPLFMRGYRTQAGRAPLKEALAAAILRLSGWDRETPLLDPMCGSGTLAIEAALWAGNIAPGLLRENYGFQRWADFDATSAEELASLKGELRARAHRQHPRIIGADIDDTVLAAAKTNARNAGVKISFRRGDVRDLRPDGGPPRWLITNPPYGQRMEAGNTFFQELGSTLTRLSGWHLAILNGSPLLEANLPCRPSSRYPLRNGDVPCDLLVLDVP